ncbi:MAG: hypothetical protein K2G35_04815 [Duncaniella sp.]|nr:hypothetical protein [Duncaniella sp.]
MLSSILLLLAVEYTAVLLSVLADLVAGIRKSLGEGGKCSSWGLRRTVDKLARYYVTLFAMTAIDGMIVAASLLLGDDAPMKPFPVLTTFGAVALALIELKSILETTDEKQNLLRTLEALLRMKGGKGAI